MPGGFPKAPLRLRLESGAALLLHSACRSDLQPGEALLIVEAPPGFIRCRFLDVLHQAMRDDERTAEAIANPEDIGRLLAHLRGGSDQA
jgi:hypothetical protein